jgi:hypothetical protein
VQWLRPVRTCTAVLGALLALSLTSASPASAADDGPQLLVVAVPGLLWDDVPDMPQLQEFLGGAAVGNLSVKSLTSVTRCGDGLLTLSAGARAGHATAPCDVDILTEEEARKLNADGPFEARLGAFGQALQDGGLRTVAVGGAAHLLLANDIGGIDAQTPDESTALATGDAVAVVLPELYDAVDAARVTAAAAVDEHLGRLIASVGPATVVAVVGVSDLELGRTHLHAFAMRAPGRTSGSLTTVQRPPFLQLVDVAPTLLDALDIRVPAVMDGAIADPSGKRPSISALADADVHATSAARLGSIVRLVLWLTTVVLALLWLASVRRARLTKAVRTIAWPLAFAPVLTYLVQAVPWWRAGRPAYGVFVAGAAVLVGVVAAKVAGRWRFPGAVVLLPSAFTVAVLVADQLAGAPLQFSAPLGDNPMVAGRFRGMGNTAFALLTTSTVLLVAVLGKRLLDQQRRRAAVAVAIGMTVLALVVDGLPFLGDDFGGMLAFLPVAAGLVVVVAALRLTVTRVVVGLLALASVVVLVAVGDYLRPVDTRTHIGRFVADVLDGDAGHVIARKARASLRSFTNVPALLAVLAGVTVTLATRRRAAAEAFAPATPALLGLLALLGSTLNDSGVVVAAFVAVVAVPSLVLVTTADGADPELARTQPVGKPGDTGRDELVAK